MNGRDKFTLVENGPDWIAYCADIKVADGKFLVVTASTPTATLSENTYLALTLDDGANPCDLGEVVISVEMFSEITGHKFEETVDFTEEDWRAEVSAGDTRLGYDEWVVHQKEAAAHDREMEARNER